MTGHPEQLRSAWSEHLLAQGIRFILSGGIVALVYIVATTVLSVVVGIHFQLALAIGFAIGLATHFTLQRLFVWSTERGFALALHHQIVRYLAIAAGQYGVTALITAVVPRAVGLPTELVYLATVVVVSGSNFLVFRGRVFHAAEHPAAEQAPADQAATRAAASS